MLRRIATGLVLALPLALPEKAQLRAINSQAAVDAAPEIANLKTVWPSGLPSRK